MSKSTLFGFKNKLVPFDSVTGVHRVFLQALGGKDTGYKQLLNTGRK